MATISSLGSGSGLDLNGLLTSLMTAEQQPLLALKTKEASYQSRISALGSLKGALSAVQTAAQGLIPATGQSASDKFATYRATVSDTTLATATVATGAGVSTYTLSNITLARNEQIRKTGFTLPAATDGTLSIKIGSGAAVDVSVKGGSTLADVRDAINASTAGVTASIINNGTADYLTLTAKESGQTNQITITSSIAAWNSFDYAPPGSSTPDYINNNWTEQQEARSASVDINGLTVTSSSNTISTAISGVTINLLKESSAGTTLAISKDTTTSLITALTTFVKAYNEANTTMSSLGAYNATTKVAGALQGDSSLRLPQTQIRNLLFSVTSESYSSYQRLSDIGVTLGKDGKLTLDSAKLTTAATADYSTVASLAANIGKAYDSAVDGLVSTTGTISSAVTSTNSMIKSNTERQTQLVTRLTAIEARYRAQFTALDALIGGMKQTSTYLTQQLANLPGVTSSSK